MVVACLLHSGSGSSGEKVWGFIAPLLSGFFLLCRLVLFHDAVVGVLGDLLGGDAKYKRGVQYVLTLFLIPGEMRS